MADAHCGEAPEQLCFLNPDFPFTPICVPTAPSKEWPASQMGVMCVLGSPGPQLPSVLKGPCAFLPNDVQ